MITRVLAIAGMTMREGIRMRVVLILLGILTIVLARLPFIITGDETLVGRLRTFLDYSLASLGILLSLSAVVFSASTLAQEYKRKSLHLLVTKPVRRVEILLGKWLGINALLTIVLVLSGGAIYGLALLIKEQGSTAADGGAWFDEVRTTTLWTARVSQQPTPPDFLELAEQYADQQVQTGNIPEILRSDATRSRMIELETEFYTISRRADLGAQVYIFDDLPPISDDVETMELRFEARLIPPRGSTEIEFGLTFVDPENPTSRLSPQFLVRGESDSVTLFPIPISRDNTPIRDGRLGIEIVNFAAYSFEPGNLRFDSEEGISVLYRVGAFENNYLRALYLVALRYAFLSAVGLFFGAFTSFPVAVFCGLTWYLVSMARWYWLETVEGDFTLPNDTFGIDDLLAMINDNIAPFILRGLFPDFVSLSGTNQLIDGLVIPMSQLGSGTLSLLVYGVGILFVLGWPIFSASEVAGEDR